MFHIEKIGILYNANYSPEKLIQHQYKLHLLSLAFE